MVDERSVRAGVEEIPQGCDPSGPYRRAPGVRLLAAASGSRGIPAANDVVFVSNDAILAIMCCCACASQHGRTHMEERCWGISTRPQP